MNKEILTVLGCSSSLAVLLMTGNSAQANTAKEYVFTASSTSSAPEPEVTQVEAEYPWYDCSCSEYSAEAREEIDRQGDKAIALFGCDCAGCRNLVRNLEDNIPKQMPQS
jgi:hypothetical protein